MRDVQPCPTLTPSRMIVSRCMRSIDRMTEPSASAPITMICLSMLSTFAITRPLELLYNENMEESIDLWCTISLLC